MANYKVKAGDSLSKIAKAKGLTVQELLKYNPDIKDANKIRVGQEIKTSESRQPVQKMERLQTPSVTKPVTPVVGPAVKTNGVKEIGAINYLNNDVARTKANITPAVDASRNMGKTTTPKTASVDFEDMSSNAKQVQYLPDPKAQQQYVKDVQDWMAANYDNLSQDQINQYAGIVGQDFMKQVADPNSDVRKAAYNRHYLTGKETGNKSDEQKRAESSKRAESHYKNMLINSGYAYNNGDNPHFWKALERMSGHKTTQEERKAWEQAYEDHRLINESQQAAGRDYKVGKKWRDRDIVQSIRDDANNTAGQMVSSVGSALNTPGHLLYSAITGNKNVLEGVLDPKYNMSASKAYEYSGGTFADNGWGKVGGVAMDIAGDPLVLGTGVTYGLRAVGNAATKGSAAKFGNNILTNVNSAMTDGMGQGTLRPMSVRSTYKGISGQNGIKVRGENNEFRNLGFGANPNRSLKPMGLFGGDPIPGSPQHRVLHQIWQRHTPGPKTDIYYPSRGPQVNYFNEKSVKPLWDTSAFNLTNALQAGAGLRNVSSNGGS